MMTSNAVVIRSDSGNVRCASGDLRGVVRNQMQPLARAGLTFHVQEPTVPQCDVLVAKLGDLIDAVRRDDRCRTPIDELADSLQNSPRGRLV